MAAAALLDVAAPTGAEVTRGPSQCLRQRVSIVMHRYKSHVGRRYEPVIAMRFAADRLGGGRRESCRLTQGGGNEAQQGGTICNGLHLGSEDAMLPRGVLSEWERELASRTGGDGERFKSESWVGDSYMAYGSWSPRSAQHHHVALSQQPPGK